jgi:Domain of unknown function (DUF4286)
MIIYNVTVNIDNDVREEWLNWMKTVHVPEVMKTGYFIENMICKVLVSEEQGTTYSVQYTCDNIKEYEEYKLLHAPRLQKIVATKYGSKLVAFRTLLEIV